MMDTSGMYVGLDIGTTSIKVIVAEYLEGQLNVLGVGNERSAGLSVGSLLILIRQAKQSRMQLNLRRRKLALRFTMWWWAFPPTC